MRLLHLLGGNGSLSDGDGGRGGVVIVVVVVVVFGAPHRCQARAPGAAAGQLGVQIGAVEEQLGAPGVAAG